MDRRASHWLCGRAQTRFVLVVGSTGETVTVYGLGAKNWRATVDQASAQEPQSTVLTEVTSEG